MVRCLWWCWLVVVVVHTPVEMAMLVMVVVVVAAVVGSDNCTAIYVAAGWTGWPYRRRCVRVVMARLEQRAESRKQRTESRGQSAKGGDQR
jgi:uncharacterized membrane protein YgcG